MDIEKLTKIALSIAEENNSDVLLYNGPIDRPYDDKVIEECAKTRRRENVILILCTLGGDPGAGYRIARCLQQNYKKFTVWIVGPCKSAGTLITMGAHEIVMSDHGEMGPLDVQVGKKDELWETDSGLTVLSAIKALEEKSFELFESCFLNLKGRSGGRITLKTATELATKLAIGTVSPIIAQIDPIHVGEVSRAMDIGLEYGKRLSDVSNNSKPDTLQKLINSYPSHDFVIDRRETKNMFANVRKPTDKEIELIAELGPLARSPNAETGFFYLSESTKEELHENHNQGDNLGGSETCEQTDAGSDRPNGTQGAEAERA
jgi:hypothetical protein